VSQWWSKGHSSYPVPTVDSTVKTHQNLCKIFALDLQIMTKMNQPLAMTDKITNQSLC